MLLISLALLMGCTNKNVHLIYQGKSPHWEVTYSIEGNKESHDSYYTFKYVGNNENNVINVEFSIDGPKEGESGSFILHNTNEYSGKMSITGGLPNKKDRGIKVKVQWEGQDELLLLQPSKS